MYLTANSGRILGPIATFLGWIMDKIYLFFENMGIENVALSIIVFTIFIYICLFPLTYKQQKFSMLSQKMQPEIKAIQAKYNGKKDQASMQAMQNETTAVYDKYGVSPTGSCIQLAIQMPILFALYRVFNNIPAYIQSVKNIFTDKLVGEIMATDGYANKLQTVWDAAKIRTVQVDFTTTDHTAMSNYIVDMLYKLNSDGWNNLTNSFSSLSSTIDGVKNHLERVNMFLVLNISDTPWDIIKDNYKTAFGVCIVAALIPIFSYISQVVSIKLTPTAANSPSGDNQQADAMAQQMKMMNNVMPLFSLFLCFTVPVGLGIYWVIGAVIRAIQQVFLNKHFKKIDLDEIIEKNKDKAAKKAEKRGIRAQQISSMATMNTRSMSDKANIGNSASNSSNDNVSSTASKPAPGSLAAKANMVKDYNERNNK